ncbi:MAG TPA: hypothetical protein VFD43_13445, partial [Planctomycetota bacterium]|nr:hypothetical protein [Planctomycetota bacterium]
MTYIGELSPETRRAVAAALAYREQHGAPMRVVHVLRLARAEGASPSAVLVLTHGKALGSEGWAVSLGDEHARID